LPRSYLLPALLHRSPATCSPASVAVAVAARHIHYVKHKEGRGYPCAYNTMPK
jgi:hypothetical protein